MELFKQDFHWMQRERKGLFPWVRKHPWRLLRLLHGPCCDHPFCRHMHEDGDALVNHLLHNKVLDNGLFDILLKALIRAEVRFISRFVLQRSHEERLTGNIVSEIDAALFLLKDDFSRQAVQRYGVSKEIDFFYYDLSRGGKLEKQTGADLGFIVVVDLPDHPRVIRSVVLQAKKCDGNPTVDLTQRATLRKKSSSAAAYLFYDMNHSRLLSPLVLLEADLDDVVPDKTKDSAQKTVTVKVDDIVDHALPLSFFLVCQMVEGVAGMEHRSFDAAFDGFRRLAHEEPEQAFDGRIGIVSVGKPIALSQNQDGGLAVAI